MQSPPLNFYDENKFIMNSQIIVPITIIVLIAIVMAIAFLNKRDGKEMEEQLKRDVTAKKLSDVDEGEKQTV